jgi:hypothetical protein
VSVAKEKPSKKQTKQNSLSKSSAQEKKKNAHPPRTASQPDIRDIVSALNKENREELVVDEGWKQFIREDEEADMDNHFGDTSNDFLKKKARYEDSDSSDDILASWESPDNKKRNSTNPRKRFAPPDRQNARVRRKNTSSTRTTFMNNICSGCKSTDCHDRTMSDFLESSLEAFAIANNKKTLTHHEVYNQYTNTYNTIMAKKTHDVTRVVAHSSLLLPKCMYLGSFTKMVKQWSVDLELQRATRRGHLAWLKKCELDITRQRKRRNDYNK